MGKFIDLTGQRFGQLTVIKKGRIDVTKSGRKIQRWVCKCDCGNIEEVIGDNLRKGTATKCKKCQKPNLIGQRFNHFLVLSRGEDKIRKNGKHVVQWKCQCDCGNIRYLSTTELKGNRWKSCGCMHDYYSHINNIRHGDSHKRLHNTWLDMKAQNNNRRNNRRIKAFGMELTMGQWSEKTGINASAIRSRIDRSGYSPEKALTTPIRKNKTIT